MVHALVGDFIVDEIIGPSRGGGFGSWGKWEGVDVDEFGAVDDVQSLIEVVVGFAGEGDDDVGGEGWAIESCFYFIDHAEKIGSCVLAIHAMEDFVGTALQGQMKMRDDLRMRFHGGD